LWIVNRSSLQFVVDRLEGEKDAILIEYDKLTMLYNLKQRDYDVLHERFEYQYRHNIDPELGCVPNLCQYEQLKLQFDDLLLQYGRLKSECDKSLESHKGPIQPNVKASVFTAAIEEKNGNDFQVKYFDLQAQLVAEQKQAADYRKMSEVLKLQLDAIAKELKLRELEKSELLSEFNFLRARYDEMHQQHVDLRSQFLERQQQQLNSRVPSDDESEKETTSRNISENQSVDIPNHLTTAEELSTFPKLSQLTEISPEGIKGTYYTQFARKVLQLSDL
jgi:hypothetical protein